MDTFKCISSKLDIREFAKRDVPPLIKRRVLEAARLSPSGMNKQHWRFILVDDPQGIKKLARDSTTGRWVADASFAVIVLTDPRYGFHAFDAGRVVQDMELAAWNEGVGSGVFTGVNRGALAADFHIPKDLDPTAAVGFGYPSRKLRGRKNRLPLEELAYSGRFGSPLGELGQQESP